MGKYCSTKKSIFYQFIDLFNKVVVLSLIDLLTLNKFTETTFVVLGTEFSKSQHFTNIYQNLVDSGDITTELVLDWLFIFALDLRTQEQNVCSWYGGDYARDQTG